MTVLVEGHLDYLTGTNLIMILGGLISAGKLAIAVDLSRALLADSSALRCLLRQPPGPHPRRRARHPRRRNRGVAGKDPPAGDRAGRAGAARAASRSRTSFSLTS